MASTVPRGHDPTRPRESWHASISAYPQKNAELRARRDPLNRPLDTRRKSLSGLAGAPGFEPGDGGIKIRCLTTWLRPIPAAGISSPGDPHAHIATVGQQQWRRRPTPTRNAAVPASLECLVVRRGRSYKTAPVTGRSVAQPGSAPASGAGGRRFESCHSDHQTSGAAQFLRLLMRA